MNFDLADPGLLLAYLSALLDEEAVPVAPDLDARVVRHRDLFFDRMPDRQWVSGPFTALDALFARRGAKLTAGEQGAVHVAYEALRVTITREGTLVPWAQESEC